MLITGGASRPTPREPWHPTYSLGPVPDFNEDPDIISAYFELMGYFVRANVPYQPGPRADTSDIDIVAVHPLIGDCVACEVKGWHTRTDRLTMGSWKEWKLLNFTREPANAAVRELVGNRSVRHVLVAPPLGPQNPEKVRAYAAEHDVELLHWPELLKEIARLVSLNRNARNPTDHLLRLLRVHGLLDVPE